ncbi:MAG: hypothetical protein ACP59X_06645 [Solidesulfovibrio sp. DCME]|uniref:hypothetical protein n=1 Tax=Solidesulfovibrio sp. DCME TaxID=3447380 RepID=UPI003D1362B8
METVKAAKSFIEAELEKYGTWEEFRSSVCGGTILPMIDNGQAFAKVKGAGPGIETIHAFLGKQWSRYLIENTLSVIRQEEDAARKKAEAYEAAQRAKEEKEKRQAASPMGGQRRIVPSPAGSASAGLRASSAMPTGVKLRPSKAVISNRTLSPWRKGRIVHAGQMGFRVALSWWSGNGGKSHLLAWWSKTPKSEVGRVHGGGVNSGVVQAGGGYLQPGRDVRGGHRADWL